MWHRYMLIVLLFLGVLSIEIKIIEGRNVKWSYEEDIQSLTQSMRIRGLILSGNFNLNYEGTFIAHIYRYSDCDGGWLVTPIYRNSEAVSLFARQAVYQNYEVGTVFYILDWELYDEFPDLYLWHFQKLNAVKRMFGIAHDNNVSVYAIRHFGACLPRHSRDELL
ncbi:MAG: hypothetical protein COB14_06810 [Alphaproteobacteria bacterium]|nr:MAG: hypothetical protein COB14_06810 [Alphaproteobacteria bacterium]